MNEGTSTDLEWRVRDRYREVLARERGDYLGFALSTVVRTPVVVTGTLAALLFYAFALAERHRGWPDLDPRSIVTSAVAVIGAFLCGVFLKQAANVGRNPLGPLMVLGFLLGAI